MSSILYVGCFFNAAAVKKCADQQKSGRLHRVIEHPHVTFAYKPEKVPYNLFGMSLVVRVVGYGCDGENEAFAVVFEEVPEQLCPLAQSVECPHITLSVSEHGKSVNSGKLTFEPIEPFLLTGVFGGKDENDVVHIGNSMI